MTTETASITNLGQFMANGATRLRNELTNPLFPSPDGLSSVFSTLGEKQIPSSHSIFLTTRRFCAILLAALSLTQSANAATLHWDGTDGTANADGGAGTWNTANTDWDTLRIGGSNATWSNSNPDSAVFGGTAGTVNLGSGITVGGLTFNTTAYNITTGANALTFGAPSNAILFNNIAATSITGTVGGTGNVSLSSSNPLTLGTLTLNGTSTGGWSGTTTINAGMTLSLAADNQGLLNTGGITLNGGGITLTNTTAGEAALNRMSNGAGITSNGGAITFTNTSGTNTYAETIGTVDLARGQMNIVESINQASSGSQTLTLSGLTRTGATSAITFSAAGTGPEASGNKNMIVVSGAGTTAAGQIIGAWATTGTTAALQNDYAVYNSNYVVAANIASSDQATWTSSTDTYTNATAAVALSGNRTMNALRNTAATATITLSDGVSGYTLATNGILNGATTLLTIEQGTVPGSLTAPGTTGGNLYLNAGSGFITINAPINDNGGAVTLVKSGSGELNLMSPNSNYSGGTVINGGMIYIHTDTALGATTGGVTFNGTSTLRTRNNINFHVNRTFAINEGALVTYNADASGTKRIYGQVTGSGSFVFTGNTGLSLENTNNTFTGSITISSGGNKGWGFIMKSIDDSVGAGLINLGIGSTGGGTFFWQGAPGVTKTLTNRQFALSGTTAKGLIAASGATANDNFVINKDLLITGVGNKSLTLCGTNTGANTFAGKITDGTGSVISLIKDDTGSWTLTGANTYTGATTITAGTLAVNGSLAGTSGVTVANTATLKGSGTINSSVTISSGGTLASGNSIESLAIGALSLNAGSTFAYEMNNDAAATVAADLTAVTGNLTLDLTNLANLTLTELGVGTWTSGEKLTLLSYNGTWNGGLFTYEGALLADDATFAFSGMDWQFNYNDSSSGTNYAGDLVGSSFVTMTAIPESGVALFACVGLMVLVFYRKR